MWEVCVSCAFQCLMLFLEEALAEVLDLPEIFLLETLRDCERLVLPRDEDLRPLLSEERFLERLLMPLFLLLFLTPLFNALFLLLPLPILLLPPFLFFLLSLQHQQQQIMQGVMQMMRTMKNMTMPTKLIFAREV